MIAHTPTILLVVILVGAVLSLSVGVVASRRQRDGMLYWAVGLALHTASYVVFSQRGWIGEIATIIFANVLRACAWAAFTEGIYEFYGRRPSRALIWSPVVMVFVAFALLLDEPILRLVTGSIISALQGLLPLAFMWQKRRETPGRGKYFLMTGIALAMSILLLRVAGASRDTAIAMVSMTISSPIQTISFLVALVVLTLLSIGFVLMSKDRADDLNRILAIRDELTGLANRRRLNEVLANEWARSRRSDQSLALAMIDIDQFKNYNDHYGHQAGDECLRRVAQAIQSAVDRGGDLATRYGGEEFLVILPDTDLDAGQHVAERIRKLIEALDLPHAVSSSGRVTISIGVAALSGGHYKDAESLLLAADEALYRAKNGGRNQVQVALGSLAPGALVGDGSARLVQLIWRRAYESGNSLIDAQHRTLFSDANKMLSAALDGRPMTEMATLADVFIADIAQHFQDEEAIITKSAYAGASAHAVLHRTLLDKANALAERFRGGSLALGELFQYLAHEVVARHILIVDREFFPSLDVGLESQTGKRQLDSP